MPLDPRLEIISQTRPGDVGELADLDRRMRRQEVGGRNPLVARALPPLRYVGVEVGFQPGWSNQVSGAYHPAAYRRGADGYVDLEGLVEKNVLPGSPDPIFFLPSDCRPTSRCLYASAMGGRFEVWPDGGVYYYVFSSVTYVALDGARFRVA